MRPPVTPGRVDPLLAASIDYRSTTRPRPHRVRTALRSFAAVAAAVIGGCLFATALSLYWLWRWA